MKKIKNLYTNPCDEEVDYSQLCVTHLFSSGTSTSKKSALQLHAFCHLSTHSVQF